MDPALCTPVALAEKVAGRAKGLGVTLRAGQEAETDAAAWNILRTVTGADAAALHLPVNVEGVENWVQSSVAPVEMQSPLPSFLQRYWTAGKRIPYAAAPASVVPHGWMRGSESAPQLTAIRSETCSCQES